MTTPAQNKRQNLVGLVIGGRGVGKSTYLKQLADSQTAKKVLIYDTDDNRIWTYPKVELHQLKRWVSGKYKLIDTNSEAVINEMNAYLNDALVLVEDATKYIGSSLSKTLKNFILATKQRNIDLIFTFHSFRKVPPDLFNFSNYITMFKTGEDIAQFRAKIPSFERVQQIYGEIQAHPSRYHNKTLIIN
jgi:hypothetical protein